MGTEKRKKMRQETQFARIKERGRVLFAWPRMREAGSESQVQVNVKEGPLTKPANSCGCSWAKWLCITGCSAGGCT